MKSGFYTTTGNDHLSGWTKKQLWSSSQSQTYTKKQVMVSIWWSAACLIHYSFLNPSETITSEKSAQQINKMCQKLQCLQLTDQQTEPNSSPWKCLAAGCKTNTSKVEQIGLQSFASSAIFMWPVANWLPLLQASRQLFAAKMLSQPAWGIKCFSRIHWVLKHRFLHYKNKETYFSLQKCVDFNGSYFD